MKKKCLVTNMVNNAVITLSMVAIVFMLCSFLFLRDELQYKYGSYLQSSTSTRHLSPDEQLLSNQYYKKFNLKNNYSKKKVNLLIMVSTAPNRYLRRNNIRKTWWRQCLSNEKKSVECIFMTDHLKVGDDYYKQIKNESTQYNDMHFQQLSGGIEFGVRYIYHILYSMLNYDFDYFLRMDDDYFLCLEKLLYELVLPPQPYFHWGWVHHMEVDMKIRRAEESMIMFSKDIILKFLSQDPYQLLCHPWADQMIILWSDQLNLTSYYRHDYRLHHHPKVKDVPSLRKEKDICKKYIGIHGTYPEDMMLLWEHRGSNITYNGNLWNNSKSIEISEPYCWSCMNYEWYYEPKLCIKNPKWDTSKQGIGSYSGRQGVAK